MNVKKPVKTKNPFTGSPYEVIHILSDINRMQILRLLADHGELCARDILTYFPITQPTLSHHMNVLLGNNLVESRKSGRWVFYRLSESGIQKIIDIFENLKTKSGASVVHKDNGAREVEKNNVNRAAAKDNATRAKKAEKPTNEKKNKDKDKNKEKDQEIVKSDKKEKKKKKKKKK
jgi:ArsR family transcriptional regulator